MRTGSNGNGRVSQLPRTAPAEDVVQLEELTRLGLTIYEAKAYLALIRRGSSTAAEVARLAGVPRQRIYDVLASLVDGPRIDPSRPRREVRRMPPDTRSSGSSPTTGSGSTSSSAAPTR